MSCGRFSRLTYTALWYLFVPFAVLRLARRGLRAPPYWRCWPQRLGYVPTVPGGGSLWLHAVSVGEVQAAAPLLRALRERFPAVPFVVTTTTPTGARQLRALFGDQIRHAYFPFDLPGAMSRFLRRVRPRLLIVMETELWPNLYLSARRREIPLILANGRISARSARGYRRVPGLVASTLACVTVVAAQSRTDAVRFVELGAAAVRVEVVGNTKFDVRTPASLSEQADVLRGEWGRNRSVWLAASTHPREEALVLAAHATVQRYHPQALLVLVPRHLERFSRVATMCRSRGLRTARRSQRESVRPDTDVYLADTMGELMLLYAAADVAFVGGSLVPAGGHNPLEPAALGLPLLFGPHMFHVEEISRLLLARRAAYEVRDADELAERVRELFDDPQGRTVAGERARAVVEHNRGAVERLTQLAAGYLQERGHEGGKASIGTGVEPRC